MFRFDYKNLKEIQAQKTLKAAKATKAKLEFVGHYRYVPVVIQQDAPKSVLKVANLILAFYVYRSPIYRCQFFLDEHERTLRACTQCYGTVLFFTVPVPTVDKVQFRFRLCINKFHQIVLKCV